MDQNGNNKFFNSDNDKQMRERADIYIQLIRDAETNQDVIRAAIILYTLLARNDKHHTIKNYVSQAIGSETVDKVIDCLNQYLVNAVVYQNFRTHQTLNNAVKKIGSAICGCKRGGDFDMLKQFIDEVLETLVSSPVIERVCGNKKLYSI
jgi:hypothetical protein